MTKSANLVVKTNTRAERTKHGPVLAKLANPCRNAVPDAKISTGITAFQQGNCTGNSKGLQQTKCLWTVVDERSVLVQFNICEVPSDTGGNISSLSPEVFDRLVANIQSPLISCFKRLPTANQGKKVWTCSWNEKCIIDISIIFLIHQASKGGCH